MASDNTTPPPPADDIASWFIMTYTRLPLDSKAHRELVARIAALQAERDRLRAALEKAAQSLAADEEIMIDWDANSHDGLLLAELRTALQEGGE